MSYAGRSTRTSNEPVLLPHVFNTTELNYAELSKWNLDSSVFGFHEDILKDKSAATAQPTVITPSVQVASIRANRRRPTYAAKCVKNESAEESAESSSDADNRTATAKDIRRNKILHYRKLLTATVKVKTAIFHAKVIVMCSKDGKCIEWYKNKDSEGDENKRQLIGTLPVAKITNFKTKVDNLRYLEITAGTNTYIFVFKTREEREKWQSDFDNFVKFMKMI
ncbi:uncharacterized protein BBOV_IV008030 [Babesia bovis T2Bo]|uniref:PH domain-containing protein n=2 Tax=Babesia bovis TaxID=5865 RepID=A7ARI8_BABBO|nr:uncharacterized protein BBOV_IV008030 [Babesia bovis T2Bo]EDO07157.1 hypothetical protein BBOV_IV008030 [Babesia bovis T2Bo]|eukprot:XP_001610725.1 hypothetical protein [Babesia bovis T2Bo]